MNKKEILELKNKKLKSQIEYIKLKILEYKNKNQKPKSLINAEYTTKYFSNNKDESNSNTSELNELTKKIDYYSDEISKKKFQLDNILSINKITDLKNELKNENDKITSINDEKISLVKIYNNQVKAINDISMKFDIFNEKNDIDKINELKTIIKELEKKDKILDEKLKEQRVVYIDLNNTINKLKEKIKLIKSNKNINLSEIEKDKNYKVEIQLIQKEIADEQKLFNIEEENYKKIIYSNQNEIDRLNEEIQKRKEILEEKGKEYKKEKLNLMIKEKNKKINNKKNKYNNNKENNLEKAINNNFFITNKNEKIEDDDNFEKNEKNENNENEDNLNLINVDKNEKLDFENDDNNYDNNNNINNNNYINNELEILDENNNINKNENSNNIITDNNIDNNELIFIDNEKKDEIVDNLEKENLNIKEKNIKEEENKFNSNITIKDLPENNNLINNEYDNENK